MREIKFRAWDKNFNEMAVVLSIDFSTEDVYIEWKDGLRETRDFSEIELMQFTGLYDKNGKEVYEGDIMQMINGTSVVDFHYSTLYYITHHKVKIIGNIHDNPELLKEQ